MITMLNFSGSGNKQVQAQFNTLIIILWFCDLKYHGWTVKLRMSIPQVSWTPTWGLPLASRTQNSGFLVTITAGRSYWQYLWNQINSRWLITCVCTFHRQSNQQAGHDRWINEALDNVDDKSTKDANISAKGVLALSGSLSGTMCWPFWCHCI